MRHPLHSLCPYFGVFPADFVAKQIFAYTRRGDVIFDPFSGRGTTVFESLLNGRYAAGVDINPVAACIAGAKADRPRWESVSRKLLALEALYYTSSGPRFPDGAFFSACFHERTLRQLMFLREHLDWERSRVDRFIAAVVLGCLHGESHKSRNCLSNRMPRTISTKPDYSVRWWTAKGYTAPERDTFSVLRRVARYRLEGVSTIMRGSVKRRDARQAYRCFPSLRDSVSLIVTSPPYLDTTHYAEDQWLRLWFLGGPERPFANAAGDDRYTNLNRYWDFLKEAWSGCAALLRHDAVIVVRMGGSRVGREDLYSGLQETLQAGMPGRDIRSMHCGVTSEIKNRQTDVFRPGTQAGRYEHDFAFQLS